MRTIMVVDDEPALRSYAESLLEELGYSAVLADCGRMAVQQLLDGPETVAAVLLDMTMPGMSPEETVRQLREIRPGLPVIILSGHEESQVRQRFRPHTIAGCIQKPYTHVELRATLLKALAEPAADEVPHFSVTPLTEHDLEEMRQEYLTTCKLRLPRMIDLLAVQDFESLWTAGHSLKGSGRCFGFHELAGIGRAIEAYAQASDAVGCGEQLNILKNYLELR